MQESLILPDWDAPAIVRACVTTRLGGVSSMPYASLNLGAHVGDDPAAVTANRQKLMTMLALDAEPLWLNQVHGDGVVDVASAAGCDADASVSHAPGGVCVVMTADCLPVLFCSHRGDEVAAAHAGWRGLAAGVLESTLSRMLTDNPDIMAWLGPAIGPTAFEVGDEVREVFLADDPESESAFVANRPGHWLADIYRLARLRLTRAGVTRIGGGNECTYTDSRRFFSYRRDGVTGRMASLIWIQQ